MNLGWLDAQGLDRLPDFLTALAIGLLMGLERERKPSAKAGLRTFALVALAGASAATLAGEFSSPSLIGIGLAAVAVAMIAAYYHHHEAAYEIDPGTTTIAAVIVCYLLAAMAMTSHSRLAVMIAILATTLLYFKAELRGVAHKLERRDLVSILQFAIVTFVVLPLLPDLAFGPYQILNPRHVWFMVVLISGVSLAGYAALRLIGGKHGAVLLGLFGGMVSSTATTLAYSRHARNGSELTGLAVTVVITANLVLLARLAIITAIVAPAALTVLAPVLATALGAGIVVYLASQYRNTSTQEELSTPEIKNPAELRAALGFAALYAVVLLLSAWLADYAGGKGVYVAALASGLTDVDAITLSSLRLFGLGALSSSQLATTVVLALSANSVFKLGVVRIAGSRELFYRCLPTMAAVVAAAAIALRLFA
ncbi:MAG: MgtC/SapB family protein [Pseudomonadota bacterium]